MRRPGRLLLPLALAALAAGLALAAPAAPETAASAIGVRITVPDQEPVVAAALGAPPAGSTDVAAFAFPEGGSIVSVGAASGSVAAAAGASASAQATAGALTVSLFGGEITADSIVATATALAGSATASADSSRSAIRGLIALGQPLAAEPNQQLPLADWGVLELLTGTADSAGAPSPRAAAGITGLRVRLSLDHGGLPAGSEIELGVAEASAAAEPEPAPPRPAPPRTVAEPEAPVAAPPRTAATAPAAPRPPASRPAVKPAPKRPATAPARRPPATLPQRAPEPRPSALDELVQAVPEGVLPIPTTGGYVFPVYGPASFGDSFGAPRPKVEGGWHHGEDIVAPLGAPVLAVADGTVFSVGWNDLGGWRLWLRDRQGNQFYYAHLSAYSPLAVEGRAVRAGDVLGFVGRTGDAEGGSFHLHFEIHPAALLSLGHRGVVAPYPYLVAWRRAEDVSFAAGRTYLPSTGGPARAKAPAVGALLLEASDISRASGLVPGALERALVDGAGERSLAVPAP